MPSTVKGVSKAGVTVALPGGAALSLPVKPQDLCVGEEVCLGVRPEHLGLGGDGQLHGDVRFIERLGGTTFLHVQIESGQELILEAHCDDSIHTHDRFGIKVNRESCYLFNKAGGAIPRASARSLADT